MAQIMAKSPAQCGTSWYNSVAQCGTLCYIIVVRVRLWQIQAVSKSTLIAYLSSRTLLLLLLLEIQSWQSPSQHWSPSYPLLLMLLLKTYNHTWFSIGFGNQKYRKSCKSCQSQVTWKFKYKSQFCPVRPSPPSRPSCPSCPSRPSVIIQLDRQSLHCSLGLCSDIFVPR